MNCPKCNSFLMEIRKPADSPLNRDQWEASIPGHYFCRSCEGNRGNTKYRYYWRYELTEGNIITTRKHTSKTHTLGGEVLTTTIIGTDESATLKAYSPSKYGYVSIILSLYPGWSGRIDLSKKNAEKLRGALGEFLEKDVDTVPSAG